MGADQLKPEDATWWDHHELTFWLWACMRNGEAYLSASHASSRHSQDGIAKARAQAQAFEERFPKNAPAPGSITGMIAEAEAEMQFMKEVFSKTQAEAESERVEEDLLSKESTLAAYHFVAAMGVLIRVLKRAQHLFPKIQPPYSRANHLLKEGKETRDMIEHAYGKDGYLAGGGENPDKFVRAQGNVAADAISTLVNDEGHWLGNRLCVEKAMREVQAIKDVADTIKAPTSRDDDGY